MRAPAQSGKAADDQREATGAVLRGTGVADRPCIGPRGACPPPSGALASVVRASVFSGGAGLGDGVVCGNAWQRTAVDGRSCLQPRSLIDGRAFERCGVVRPPYRKTLVHRQTRL